MARNLEGPKREESHRADGSILSAHQTLDESPCERCGGLMVLDSCLDLLADAGEIDCTVVRCVQCGNLVDPVILQNRARVETNDKASVEMTPEQHTVKKKGQMIRRLAVAGTPFA